MLRYWRYLLQRNAPMGSQQQFLFCQHQGLFVFFFGVIHRVSVLLRNCQVKSLLWNARGISPEGLAFEKEKRLSPRNKTKKCHLKVAPRQGGARSEASSERKPTLGLSGASVPPALGVAHKVLTYILD